MKTIVINEQGVVKKQKIDKLNFVNIFSLNIRDLRPVFSDLQVATILPRNEVVVINLGFIKVILSKSEVYILQHSDSKILNKFVKEIKTITNWKSKKTVFYLYILEKIFDAKQQQLHNKIALIRKKAEIILPKIQSKIIDNSFKELLHLKKKVSRMETRLNEIYLAVKEVMESENNFTELISLGKNDKQNNRLEAESILENFIEQIEDDMGSVFRLKEEMEDVEEYVDLKLSSRRTSIVMFDLIATVITLVLSLLAVIVGLFGANLRNGWENSHLAFISLSYFLIFIFVFLLLTFLIYLKHRKII